MSPFPKAQDAGWVMVSAVLVAIVWFGIGDHAEAGGLGPQGVDVVYVAVGTNFPDSLGAGPVGGVNGAPLIIVPTNPPIPSVTEAELLRLDPKKVVIVGGTGVISTAMEDALKDALNSQTEFVRLEGENRYATNVLLSQSSFPVMSYLSVPVSAFRSTGDPADVVFGGYEIHTTTNDGLIAPLILPHHARVMEVMVLGHDTDAGTGGSAAGDDLELSLMTVDESGAALLGCGGAASGTPGAYRAVACSFSPTGFTIDNEQATYQILVTGADGDPTLRGVLIAYEVGAPG